MGYGHWCVAVTLPPLYRCQIFNRGNGRRLAVWRCKIR